MSSHIYSSIKSWPTYFVLLLILSLPQSIFAAGRVSLSDLQSRIVTLESIPDVYPIAGGFDFFGLGTPFIANNNEIQAAGCSVRVMPEGNTNELLESDFPIFNGATRLIQSCSAENFTGAKIRFITETLPDPQYTYDGVYLCAQVDQRAIDRIDERNTFRAFIFSSFTSINNSSGEIVHKTTTTESSTEFFLDLGEIHESEFPVIDPETNDVICRHYKFSDGIATKGGPGMPVFIPPGRLVLWLEFPQLDSRTSDFEFEGDEPDGDFIIFNEIGLTISGRNQQ